jgi:aspartate aminotransferase
MRAAGQRVIDLGAGEPDFPTPAYIVEAAHAALRNGATRYTLVQGMLELREQIAAESSLLSTRAIDPGQIVVSGGTKHALFNSCFSIFGEGDEVLIPTPAWPSYYEIVALARARPIAVVGAESRSFRITAADLRAAATPRTRGVIINSPCNPTGSVYSRSELLAILEEADRQGWWVISDEIYRHISYGERATSALEVASGFERLVVVDGVAKSFAMPGWRIGWSISTGTTARTMTALQSHTTSNAATISQYAALAALSDKAAAKASLSRMVDGFRQRRDAGLALLDAAGVRATPADGAFYFFIQTRSRAEPSKAAAWDSGASFADWLLATHGVAVVAGESFRAPPGWIRVSYAASDEHVEEGLRQIIGALTG